MRNENMRYETTTSFTFTNDGGGGVPFFSLWVVFKIINFGRQESNEREQIYP